MQMRYRSNSTLWQSKRDDDIWWCRWRDPERQRFRDFEGLNHIINRIIFISFKVFYDLKCLFLRTLLLEKFNFLSELSIFSYTGYKLKYCCPSVSVVCEGVQTAPVLNSANYYGNWPTWPRWPSDVRFGKWWICHRRWFFQTNKQSSTIDMKLYSYIARVIVNVLNASWFVLINLMNLLDSIRENQWNFQIYLWNLF